MMNSPQQQGRRDIRYPLHMPVSVKLASKEILTRSENISLRGILLSSASPIPQGSTVDVAVGVANLPDHGVQLSARGKVLRVRPEPSGDFAVAIGFEGPFQLGLKAPDQAASQGKPPRTFKAKNRLITAPGLNLARAWHTET
jgi:PilZ domain